MQAAQTPGHSIAYDDGAEIKDREHSIWIIQQWIGNCIKARRSLKSLKASSVVGTILRVFDGAVNSRTVDEAQAILFQEAPLRAISSLFTLLPADTLARERNSNVMLARKLITGIMVSLFPDEVLESGSPGPTRNSAVKLHSTSVRFAAIILRKSFARLLKDITRTSPEIGLRRQRLNIVHFQFALRYFLQKFQAWKVADAESMRASMEETFAQAYATLLAAKVAWKRGEADEAMVQVAEEQTQRIKYALGQLLGPQRANERLEEIVASIEASSPEYVRLFQRDPETVPSTPKEVSNTSGDSTPISLPPTQLDTKALRRTLTPLPSEQAPSHAAPSSVTDASPGSASTAAAQSDTSSTSNSEAEASKYLSLLSKLAGGMENERLAHELTLDKNYRLPTAAPPRPSLGNRRGATPTSSASNATSDGPTTPASGIVIRDQASLAQILRERLLNVLADKHINALRRSNVQSHDDVRIGMVVPVKYFAAKKSINEETADDVSVLTAEILYLSSEESAAERVIRVRYLADEAIEDNVPITRIVLASEPPRGEALVSGLYDLARNIASYTPQRKDIVQRLATLFDPALLRQVVAAGALSLTKDLAPIFLSLKHAVMRLQAEYRLEYAVQWLRAFETLIQDRSAPQTSAAPSAPLTGGSQAAITPASLWETALQRYFALSPASTGEGDNGGSHDSQQSLALIPLFFERMAECLEDVQRDLANYYISQLVPILQVHGTQFLAARFQDRLQRGLESLDKTAQLLQLVLLPMELLTMSSSSDSNRESTVLMNPAQNSCAGWQNLLAHLIEAEVVDSSTLTVQELAALSTISFDSSDSSSDDTNASSNAASSGSSSTITIDRRVRGVVAVALCALLQAPIRLDTPAAAQWLLPETLRWDGKRLADLRDLVDLIALESALVFSTRQLLARYKLVPRDSEETQLQHRVDVLLQDALTNTANESSSHGTVDGQSSTTSTGVNSDSLVQEVVAYVQYAWHRTSSSSSSSSSSLSSSSTAAAMHSNDPQNPLARFQREPVGTSTVSSPGYFDLQELQTRARALIQETILSPQSPVLLLFTKRVYKVLLRACLHQPVTPQKLKSYSLQSAAQERNLSRLLEQGQRLCTHTLAVHGPVYVSITKAIAQQLSLLQQSQPQPSG